MNTHRALSLLLLAAAVVCGQPLPTVGPATLPAAAVGTAYSATLTVTGGTAPYKLSIAGSLPPGVTLNTTGTISGTPTAAGSFTFTVTATDANLFTGSTKYTLTVAPPALTITTLPPLFNGTVGAPYAQTFAATGGVAPYTWVLTSGSVPGLTFDAKNAVLSGTPTTAGTFAFTLSVTDTGGASATQAYSLVVTIPPLTITAGAPLPAGTVGASYSQKLPVVASGGTPPYTWSLSSGSVPGLTFDPATVSLSGTPTTPGTFSFTVQVADSAGLTATKALSLTINPGTLTITTPRALPDGALNTAYPPVTMAAAGGVPPYTWAANGLPAGLTINASSGVISGTPTAGGSFGMAITVTDSALTHYSDRFTMNVSLPTGPAVTISGLSGTVAPAKQLPLQITLGSAYASLITGQATLSFTPDSGPPDKTIVFASGGTTANFTVPAGSTTATSDVPLAIQTGTVSGTITVTVHIQAGGVDITPSATPAATGQIARAAPVISGVQVSRTSNSLALAITGYSTAREVTQAVFTFQAAAGQTLQSSASSITVDVTTLFNNWFQGTNSSQFGSQFLFTQPFTISGDPNAVIPVSVTLTNKVGSTSANVTQ